jgi:hypothetical protein
MGPWTSRKKRENVDRLSPELRTEMADRATLHLSKLKEFAEWATTRGFVREEPKDCYGVLRLRHRDKGVVVYYKRAGAKEHATATAGLGESLVRQWLRDGRARDQPQRR